MKELIEAVNQYDYPATLFDFNKNKEIIFGNYRDLESHMAEQLRSNNLECLKDGLSNVLYWGFYRFGYGNKRVSEFRSLITDEKLIKFKELVQTKKYSCMTIKDIEMPQFSQLAFTSKLLMFIDPINNVTLDSKIMLLKDSNNLKNPITNIKVYPTSIPITKNNQDNYMLWCKLCRMIASEYFQDKLSVDIERGFFKLVENNQIEDAKQIIRANSSLLK